MNEKTENLIQGLGAMCEMWTIVFETFIAQGMHFNEALSHTQSFMAVLIRDAMGKHD